MSKRKQVPRRVPEFWEDEHQSITRGLTIHAVLNDIIEIQELVGVVLDYAIEDDTDLTWAWIIHQGQQKAKAREKLARLLAKRKGTGMPALSKIARNQAEQRLASVETVSIVIQRKSVSNAGQSNGESTTIGTKLFTIAAEKRVG